ncbi:hypothetical protein GCM10009740_38600 [Terrabacter terrae]|uniref:Uncharacterized protein n=1 Tax=Terrabacter terrae TaxID=318434 RepID=A0ABN1ZQB8_9MICO
MVRQSGRGRVIATIGAAMFIPGVLVGQFPKEDRLAVAAGSLVLLIVAWAPKDRWPFARFLSTTVTGTCLAFAGIVGLEAPAAASSWLIGAGFAGIGRYWADSLLRSASELETARLRQQLEQIKVALRQEAQDPEPRNSSVFPLTLVAMVAGLALGLSVRTRRPE